MDEANNKNKVIIVAIVAVIALVVGGVLFSLLSGDEETIQPASEQQSGETTSEQEGSTSTEEQPLDSSLSPSESLLAELETALKQRKQEVEDLNIDLNEALDAACNLPEGLPANLTSRVAAAQQPLAVQDQVALKNLQPIVQAGNVPEDVPLTGQAAFKQKSEIVNALSEEISASFERAQMNHSRFVEEILKCQEAQ